MDCSTARLLLEFHRPHAEELDATEVAVLEAHLAVCPECQAFRRTQHLIDQHLARAMRDVRLPDGLPQRLLHNLQVQRRATYRRQLSWASYRLAAAVLILAVLAAAWFWLRPPRPGLDILALLNREMAQMASPRPDGVQEWFAVDRGMRMTAPPRFNYAFLTYYGLGECQGQRVPQLVFSNGNTRASVFVVTATQFDIDQLPQTPSHLDTNGFHVEIWFDESEAPGTAFIIIYTGEHALTPLFTVSQQPAV